MDILRREEVFFESIKNMAKNYGMAVFCGDFQDEFLKQLKTKDENKDEILFSYDGVTVFNAFPYKNKTNCSSDQAKGGLVFEKFYKKGLENVSTDQSFLYEEGEKRGEFFNVSNEPYIFVSVKQK